jgi:hypothetical protein
MVATVMNNLEDWLTERGCNNVRILIDETKVEVANLGSAIIFVNAPWSGPCKAGLITLARAIAEFQKQPLLILLDTERLDCQWIGQFFTNASPLHGYGEALWIKNGTVICTTTFRKSISSEQLRELIEAISNEA